MTSARHKSHAKNVGSDFTVGFINNFFFVFLFPACIAQRQHQQACTISTRPAHFRPSSLRGLSTAAGSSNLSHKSYAAAPITVKNERTGWKPFPVMEKSAKIIQYVCGGGREEKLFVSISSRPGGFRTALVATVVDYCHQVRTANK